MSNLLLRCELLPKREKVEEGQRGTDLQWCMLTQAYRRGCGSQSKHCFKPSSSWQRFCRSNTAEGGKEGYNHLRPPL